MSKTSLQYQLPSKGSAFNLVSTPYPTPGPDEICIRTKAIALNPIDWKQRASGMMIQSWPAVLGVDAAGIVEVVGESVQGFKIGDEVFGACGMGTRGGAFQEIITVPAALVVLKPEILSFEEAASLPICYLTAASAISVGLHIPLPHLDPIASPPQNIKSVLVLGGSSAVGAGAIQLLRLALPSATILATSSEKHHSRLLDLGASKCFDRSADVSEIKAATTGGAGVDAILDTVGAGANMADVFSVLSADGPKLYSQVATGVTIEAPEGVTLTVVYGRQISGVPGGKNALPGLGALIQKGEFRLPVQVEIVGQGLEAIEGGLNRLMKGVSGTKYVVSL